MKKPKPRNLERGFRRDIDERILHCKLEPARPVSTEEHELQWRIHVRSRVEFKDEQ
ncbi:hypothetical protein M758_UG318800 [Ceratodon purpureus]|nr:hypothetical protein M758_UG318800 [Ceratodon purpureus]